MPDNDSYIKSKNIIETVLVVFLLLVLLVAVYDVMRLFFGVLTFAIIFSVSFTNLFERLTIFLKHRRKLAAFIYCILLISIIAVPLGFLFSALTHNTRIAIDWVNNVKENGLPPLPNWIARLPFVGNQVSKLWMANQDDPKQFVTQHQHQIQIYLQRLAASGLGLLNSFLQIIIGIIVSALILINPEKILTPLRLTLQHLIGKSSGSSLLEATAMSIKGVAIGVMGTALIAAVLSWIGLRIAGINFAIGLSAIVFFLVVIQLGPLFVWVPIVIWMSTQGHPGLLVFLIIWGALVEVIDIIIKPVLIGRSGGKLPFLVLFIGVLGGVAAWGFTGMFKGAIILAIFYTIYNSWLGNKQVKAINKQV